MGFSVVVSDKEMHFTSQLNSARVSQFAFSEVKGAKSLSKHSTKRGGIERTLKIIIILGQNKLCSQKAVLACMYFILPKRVCYVEKACLGYLGSSVG